MKICGAPAEPAASAFGTTTSVLPLVPTRRSPFGSPANSRAPDTFAIVDEANPDAIWIRGSVVGAGLTLALGEGLAVGCARLVPCPAFAQAAATTANAHGARQRLKKMVVRM